MHRKPSLSLLCTGSQQSHCAPEVKILLCSGSQKSYCAAEVRSIIVHRKSEVLLCSGSQKYHCAPEVKVVLCTGNQKLTGSHNYYSSASDTAALNAKRYRPGLYCNTTSSFYHTTLTGPALHISIWDGISVKVYLWLWFWLG